jgi:hypothetical protein
MAIHPNLPQTKTPESLADWIRENEIKDEHKAHTEEVPLDEDEIAEHEHKSALASRAIIALEDLKKAFTTCLRDGTDVKETKDDGTVVYDIRTFTVPPTKGLKALKANVEFHSEILENGFTTTITQIHMIPAPEIKKVIAVTIEGKEWPDYTREMTKEEEEEYGTMFSEENKIDKDDDETPFKDDGEEDTVLNF